MALLVNKDLVRKNFVKYAEWYRTLARIVNYSDKVHIDKMKEIIPDELQNALVIYEITNQSPKTWDDYLKLLMQAYKALYLDKAQGAICKDLDWDILELLLVWVDKKNSMEFPLNFLYYLYNYYMVYALSSHGFHVT